jgi:hypothetical protein
MKRAVLMALGIAAVLTSAAAFSTGGAASGIIALNATESGTLAPVHSQRRAREAQRAGIEARYQDDRARCALVSGAKRDACLIEVHASRGRAMLSAAEPYEVRF